MYIILRCFENRAPGFYAFLPTEDRRLRWSKCCGLSYEPLHPLTSTKRYGNVRIELLQGRVFDFTQRNTLILMLVYNWPNICYGYWNKTVVIEMCRAFLSCNYLCFAVSEANWEWFARIMFHILQADNLPRAEREGPVRWSRPRTARYFKVGSQTAFKSNWQRRNGGWLGVASAKEESKAIRVKWLVTGET